jgi:thioredoxin-like negative regulator of GroEL
MLFLTEESEYNAELSMQALYFYSSWMPFKAKMQLMIERVEEKHKNIAFFAIDVDYFKGLCRRFEVTSIPTVVVFIEGEVVKKLNGLIISKLFEVIFDDICSAEPIKLEKSHG